jgi:hypothetical protein
MSMHCGPREQYHVEGAVISTYDCCCSLGASLTTSCCNCVDIFFNCADTTAGLTPNKEPLHLIAVQRLNRSACMQEQPKGHDSHFRQSVMSEHEVGFFSTNTTMYIDIQ